MSWGYAGRVNLGPTELIVILVIVLVLFGGAKLPKLARSLGQAQKEFKQGVHDGEAEADASSDPPGKDKPTETATDRTDDKPTT